MKQTTETLKASERLIEAIDMAEEELEKHNLHLEVFLLILTGERDSKQNNILHCQELAQAEQLLSKEEKEQRRKEGKPLVAPFAPNPVLLGLSPSQYVLICLLSG